MSAVSVFGVGWLTNMVNTDVSPQVIDRRIRELSVESVLVPLNITAKQIQEEGFW